MAEEVEVEVVEEDEVEQEVRVEPFRDPDPRAVVNIIPARAIQPTSTTILLHSVRMFSNHLVPTHTSQLEQEPPETLIS